MPLSASSTKPRTDISLPSYCVGCTDYLSTSGQRKRFLRFDSIASQAYSSQMIDYVPINQLLSSGIDNCRFCVLNSNFIWGVEGLWPPSLERAIGEDTYWKHFRGALTILFLPTPLNDSRGNVCMWACFVAENIPVDNGVYIPSSCYLRPTKSRVCCSVCIIWVIR